jgi:hypothetical protein
VSPSERSTAEMARCTAVAKLYRMCARTKPCYPWDSHIEGQVRDDLRSLDAARGKGTAPRFS